jgi:Mg-chelatase subunit ChlD
MKTDFSKLPREEVEARITTMLFGELDADEARELMEFVAGDTELMRLHDELKATISLVQDASDAAVSLSEGKRERLLQSFKVVPIETVQRERAPVRSWLALAAMVAFLAVVTGVMFPALSRRGVVRTAGDTSSRELKRLAKWSDERARNGRGEEVPGETGAATAPVMNSPAPASEPVRAGDEAAVEAVRRKPLYRNDWFGGADRDGAAVPQTKIELPALATTDSPAEGKAQNWGMQVGQSPEYSGASGGRAGGAGGFFGRDPQEPSPSGAPESQLGFGVKESAGKDLQVFYSEQPNTPERQENRFARGSDYTAPAGQSGLINLDTLSARSKSRADRPAEVDAKKSDAVQTLTGLPTAPAANAASDSRSSAAEEVSGVGQMGGGSAMSMQYYMQNPELMKRYFPQMYQRMQREGAGTAAGAAAGMPGMPGLAGPAADKEEGAGQKSETALAFTPPPFGGVASYDRYRLTSPRPAPAAPAKPNATSGPEQKMMLGTELKAITEASERGRQVENLSKKSEIAAETINKYPSAKVTSRSQEFAAERLQTSALVQDARSLIELGKTGEAEKLLKQAQKNDPDHRAAAYYLKLVEEEKAKQRGSETLVARTELERVDVAARRLTASAAVPRPEVLTAENAFSTFSLNVSDVSFKLASASLEKGLMPDVATVRSEEFINAFDYRDPEPQGAPVGFVWERARYPFAQDRDLVRFSVKTAASGRQAGRPLNLVLLLDSSGSMERSDRVRILRECLKTLAAQLRPEDRISVVAFARTPRLWVDGLPGSQAGELPARVGNLAPEGGTNLEEAMRIAYETARKHFSASGVNRVVLLTDGAANLGDVEPESLKKKVEAERKKGIALDCFGIGWEGLNDELLEMLSRNGDGRYGFVNSTEAAGSEFAGQLAGALKVAASDVKVQVEWNPKRVTAFRQIGYAKDQLTKEQFRDNTVDAAEIGAAEAGNALYTVQVNPAGEGPLGTVRVRFKVPGSNDYREHAWPLDYDGAAKSLENSDYSLRLAGTASAFSEFLVSSPYATEVTTDRLLSILSGVPEHFAPDPRPKKLEWMIRQAKSVAGK